MDANEDGREVLHRLREEEREWRRQEEDEFHRRVQEDEQKRLDEDELLRQEGGGHVMDYPSLEASKALAEVWPDGARAVLGWTGTTWQQSSGLDDLTVDGRRGVLDEYTEAVPVRTFSEMVKKCQREGLHWTLHTYGEGYETNVYTHDGHDRQAFAHGESSSPWDAFALALAAALKKGV